MWERLGFHHRSLISSQLKISESVRHVGVCLMPTTPMTTATVSEKVDKHEESKPSLAFRLLGVSFKEQLSYDEQTYYHVSIVDLDYKGLTDNLCKPAVISHGRLYR